MGRSRVAVVSLLSIVVLASALPSHPGTSAGATSGDGALGIPSAALDRDATPLSHLRAVNARNAERLLAAAQTEREPALAALAAARMLTSAQEEMMRALTAAPALDRVLSAHPGLDVVERALAKSETIPAAADPLARPSLAAIDLAARVGAPLDEASLARIAALDATPEPARSALARLLHAFGALEAAASEVFTGEDRAFILASLTALDADPFAFPPIEEAPARNAAAWARLAEARLAFLDAARALQTAVDATPALLLLPCAPVVVPPAFAIDLTNCDNVYADDVVLLVDAQGNDVYFNNAGGNSFRANDCGLISLRAAAALVDLAGNDRYGSPQARRWCGSNGGAIDGVGFLFDGLGDDEYWGGGWATNGGSFFAAGLLMDLAGNDLYDALRGATNGGVAGWLKTTGVPATGAIVDALGSDRYFALDAATNGGAAVGGWGLVFDATGNDEYVATDAMTNGGGFGDLQVGAFGVPAGGLLVDAEGSDRYVAGSAATNGGALFVGTGGLIDLAGDDHYEASDAAANGGGLFGGHGFLADLSGSDTYLAGAGGTNGGAILAAGGFLFDATGNDVYLARGSGSNGGAYFAASGFQLDLQGNDRYGAHRPWLAYGGSDTAAALASRLWDRSDPAALQGLAGFPRVDRASVLALLRDPHLAAGRPHPGPAPGETARFTVGFENVDDLRDSVWLGARVLRVNPSLRYALVETDDPVSFEIRAILTAGVRYVEHDRETPWLRHVPDDALWGEQWAPARIRAPEAWNLTLGSSERAICVADTGLRATHEDVAGPRLLGGRDFANGDDNPADGHGHGTHVAGIAAASTGNGVGIAGIAQAGLLTAKVLSDAGWGAPSGVAEGIQWCADAGAHVVSLSLGGGHSDVLRDAVAYAWDRGALVVAAAGNSGPCVSCVTFPAAYAAAVAVGCTDAVDGACSFSSRGPEVEIAAPGQDILSLWASGDNHYGPLSGTSMSAPHVSGVAALVWSLAPALTNCEVRQLLRDHARDLGAPGLDPVHGFGLVDAHATVEAVRAGAIPGSCPALPVSPGAWAGVNGGGMLLGAGTLIDLSGDDEYLAGNFAGNGGAWLAGSGRLVDDQGNDRYVAGAQGVNGGAGGECFLVTPEAPCLGLTLASGLLLDLAGRDAYLDDEGGRGDDVTVAPKGAGGAQIDTGRAV